MNFNLMQIFSAILSIFFPSPEVCNTRECINYANLIMNNMDTTVDPCEDFYQFSCGNFIKSNRIADSKSSRSYFTELDDILTDRILNELEKPIDNKSDIESTANTKRFYQSCLNESAIEQNGEAWLLQFLSESLGGWPLMNPSLALGFNRLDKLFDFMQLTSYPLFSLIIETDPRVASKLSLTMGQSSEFFTKSYYLDTNIMNGYKSYITKIASYLGVSASNPNYLKDIEDAINLEIEFSKLLLSETELRSLDYDLYSIKELDTLLPSFKMSYLVLLKIYGANSTMKPININENETIIVRQMKYLKAAEQLFSNASQTNQKALYNMMYMKFISRVMEMMPKKYREAKLEFTRQITGVSSSSARSTICSIYASTSFVYTVGRLYIQSYFDFDSRAQANEMTMNLRNEFSKIIDETVWMDDSDKMRAQLKVKSMRLNMGFPDFAFNDTYLNKIYRRFQMTDSNPQLNLMVAFKAGFNEMFEALRDSIDPKDWIGEIAMVNAWYASDRNSITFPAGILQFPFYASKAPKYVNYGGIGMVIGHEITHGFDDQGRLFDENGTFSATGFWSNRTIQSYANRSKCFVNQYSNYKTVGLNVNGELTLGENIADNGGLKEAYRAYKEWEKKNGKEPLLPGLKYNQDQLFFISFGQIWCAKYRNEELTNRILTDVHSPSEFRILGSTSNYDQFARAFNCKANSRNNPTQKCTLW